MKLPIWSIPTLWLRSQNRLEQPTYKLAMPFSETFWRLSEQSHTAYKTYLAHIVLLPQNQSLYDGSISPWVKLTEGRPRPTFPVLTLSQCRLSQAWPNLHIARLYTLTWSTNQRGPSNHEDGANQWKESPPQGLKRAQKWLAESYVNSLEKYQSDKGPNSFTINWPKSDSKPACFNTKTIKIFITIKSQSGDQSSWCKFYNWLIDFFSS